jgi:hypothetical protein
MDNLLVLRSFLHENSCMASIFNLLLFLVAHVASHDGLVCQQQIQLDSSKEEEYRPPGNNKKRKSKVSMQQILIIIGMSFDSRNSDDDNKSDITVPHQYKVLLDSSTKETRAFFNDWTHIVPFQWLSACY